MNLYILWLHKETLQIWCHMKISNYPNPERQGSRMNPLRIALDKLYLFLTPLQILSWPLNQPHSQEIILAIVNLLSETHIDAKENNILTPKKFYNHLQILLDSI